MAPKHSTAVEIDSRRAAGETDGHDHTCRTRQTRTQSYHVITSTFEGIREGSTYPDVLCQKVDCGSATVDTVTAMMMLNNQVRVQ